MGSDCRDPDYSTSAAHQTLFVHYSSVRRIWKGVFQNKPDSTAEERKERSTHEDLSSNMAASAGLW